MFYFTSYFASIYPLKLYILKFSELLLMVHHRHLIIWRYVFLCLCVGTLLGAVIHFDASMPLIGQKLLEKSPHLQYQI